MEDAAAAATLPLGATAPRSPGRFFRFPKKHETQKRRCKADGTGVGAGPPEFCKYVDPIQTRGRGRLCPTQYHSPPPDFSTFLRPCDALLHALTDIELLFSLLHIGIQYSTLVITKLLYYVHKCISKRYQPKIMTLQD